MFAIMDSFEEKNRTRIIDDENWGWGAILCFFSLLWPLVIMVYIFRHFFKIFSYIYCKTESIILNLKNKNKIG